MNSFLFLKLSLGNSYCPSPKNKKLLYNQCGGLSPNNRRKNFFSLDQLQHRSQHKNKQPRILKEMIKVKNILKFIKKSRQRSKFRKPDKLKTLHYEIIKDDSHINNNQWAKKTISNRKTLRGHSLLPIQLHSEKRSYIENTKLLAKKIYKRIPIIQANSKQKLLWDIFIFIIVIIEMLMISIEISFKENLGGYFGSEKFFDIFPFLMLVANIILEFNTNFYEHGVSEVNRKRIAHHYIQNHFLFDLLATISLGSYFFLNQYHSIFKIGFIMIYKTLKKISDNIQETYRLNGDMFDLFSLIIKTLCMAHIIACIWHAIGYYNIEFNASWLSIDGRKDLPIFNRYIMSLYWAFTTISTVGYGDISPQNIGEMAFCSLIMMIGTFGLGYCVNTVGGILSRIDERSKELNEKMRIIENFMLRSNVNITLRVKVKKYLEFLLKYDNKIIEKENELIGILPNSLRNEILLETNLKFLKDIHILSKNFSDKLLEFLSLNVKPTQYSPSEIIYSQGDYENSSLFFVYEGEVDLLLNDMRKNQIVLKTLRKGEHFCEIPFFTSNKAAETAQSRGFSTIFKISREEFLEFLKDFPKDHERFCEIRDKYIFSQNINQHFNKCISCNEQGHFLEKCPLINYCPDKEFLIERLNFSRPQERNFQFRKYMKKNSFAIKSKAIQGVIKMRFNKKLMRKYFISDPSLKTNVKNNEESYENFGEYDNSEKEDEEITIERSKSLTFISESQKIPDLQRKCSLEELKNISKQQLGETFYPKQKEINHMLNRNTYEEEDIELLKKLNQNHLKNSTQNLPSEKSEKDLSKMFLEEDSSNKFNKSRTKFVNFENSPLLNKSEESKEKINRQRNKKNSKKLPTIKKLRDSSETLNSPKLRQQETLKIPIIETLSSIVLKQGNKLDSNEKIKSQISKTNLFNEAFNKFKNLNINISRSNFKQSDDSKEISENLSFKQRKTTILKNGKNNNEENLSQATNMFIYDFEVKKDFKNYFKNNNSSIILTKHSSPSEISFNAKRKKLKK